MLLLVSSQGYNIKSEWEQYNSSHVEVLSVADAAVAGL